ncbi:MAG: thiol peroxidase [Planctomycetota bacterium]
MGSKEATAQDVQVTMKGDPVTLIGRIPEVGDQAPDAVLHKNDLSETRISDHLGQSQVLILTVPSLDTSVCDQEVRRFNEAAADLPNTKVLVVSMDLPFSQERWCAAAGIENVETLSDHARADFGEAYGVLIEGLRLLTRTIFVVDPKGTIRYREIVSEITNQPDFDAALEAARA